jgi:hypothetical protein
MDAFFNGAICAIAIFSIGIPFGFFMAMFLDWIAKKVYEK